MSQKNDQPETNMPFITALDLGSSTIEVVIAQVNNGQLKVVGIGHNESAGIKNGIIVNIDQASAVIRKTIEEAEKMSGLDIKEVFVGISGSHIKGVTNNAIIPIDSAGREITDDDVQSAYRNASIMQKPPEQGIIHLIPMDYVLDRQGGITNPVGMSGVRLEANFYVVMASNSAKDNIKKAVERAGPSVAGVVLTPLAAATAVLLDEQRELGVIVIDMGGGTTDVAIYGDNALRHAASISVGSIKVTDDLAAGLHISKSNAEKLKIESGSCVEISRIEDASITIKGIGRGEEREIARSEMVPFIRPRVEEIFRLVNREIEGHSIRAGAGIVLTGGGAELRGVLPLAKEIFKQPVQIGLPTGFSGVTQGLTQSQHATVMGLLMWAYNEWKENGETFEKRKDNGENPLRKIWDLFRRFF